MMDMERPMLMEMAMGEGGGDGEADGYIEDINKL